MNSQEIGIQCPDISSTSDIYHCPINSNFSFRGRPSYRKSFRRLSLENPRLTPLMLNRRNDLSSFISRILSMYTNVFCCFENYVIQQ